MWQNYHRYEYLYHSLVRQIRCGYLLSGQKLPSQADLCRQYNVGITTVRKVIHMLSDAGFVRSAAGRPAEVIFQGTPESYAACLLQRKNAISDTFQGLSILMPPLYTEGARHLTSPNLKKLRQIAGSITDTSEPPEVYRQANLFFSSLLRPLHNTLIMDLENDSEVFLRIPSIPLSDIKDPLSITGGRVKKWLERAVEFIGTKSYDLLYERIQAMYLSACRSVNQYMDALERIVRPRPSIPENRYWFASRGHSELYAEVAMLLLRRIAVGEFEENKYLPSIPEIMREYGVVKDTACRALSFLNQIGAVRTIDKKGTVPANGIRTKKAIDLENPLIRQRIELFLDGMQIMVLTSRANADMIFPLIEESHVRPLEKRLAQGPDNRMDSIAIQVLSACLTRLTPFHSLRNIYEQLSEVMLWGYYLEAIDKSLYSRTEEIKKGIRSLIQSVKTRDRLAFLDSVEFIFTQIDAQARIAFHASYDVPV